MGPRKCGAPDGERGGVTKIDPPPRPAPQGSAGWGFVARPRKLLGPACPGANTIYTHVPFSCRGFRSDSQARSHSLGSSEERASPRVCGSSLVRATIACQGAGRQCRPVFLLAEMTASSPAPLLLQFLCSTTKGCFLPAVCLGAR